MALAGKKAPKAKKSEDRVAKYVSIMQVCEGQQFEDRGAREYLRANNYKGRLIWHEYGGENGDDPTSGNYYEIKTAFIGEPHESAPKFILQNIVVNLANENAAVKMQEDE